MKKRILSLVLAMAMLCAFVPCITFAETSGTCGADGDNLTWTLDDNGTLTISGEGDMYDYYYPDNASWYDVRQSITSVVINDHVTSIGAYAFAYCYNLTSVMTPDSVTSIGDSTFSECYNLMSITISDSVTSIGEDAFARCGYSNNPENWTDGVLYIDNCLIKADYEITKCSIKNNCRLIADNAFDSCDGLTSITIPDSVTSIGSHAFYKCNGLTNVTIGSSVASIGDGAFAFCHNLTSVTIPNSVTYIGNAAFEDCSSLTSVTIGNGVTSVGDYAFWSCGSLTNVTIPDSITSIGDCAFSSCGSLTNVTIPDSVTSIGDCAFSSCDRLTSVFIPNSVTSIGFEVFSGCGGLTSVTIPNSVTSIGAYAFYYCDSLTSVTIPDSVTSIGDGVFQCCDSLTSITIPDSVTSIGDYAFSSCYRLTSVTIPVSVTSIGDYAFYDCDGLTDVYYGGDEARWNEIFIGSYNEDLTNATIHYNSYMKDDGTIGEYEPPVERTISASFSGGYGIVYDADADSYNMSSFTLTAILENLYIIDDVYRNDFLAKNVTMNITLPQGFSFALDSTVSERNYDIGNIDYRIAADDTIYLQKPSAGTATIKVRITGDNVKTADFTYDIVIDRYAFDVDIYRANFLTTSTLGNTMEDTYFNLPKSPSQQLRKAGKECGMDGTTGAWKLLMDTMDTLDNPSSIADYVFEEKDMYEAIIMSMFESSVNFKVMSCINNDITKDTRNFENDVTSMMKNMYEYDGFSTLDLTKLSKEEKDNLFKNCDAAFKKAHPNAADIDKMTGFIGKAIDYASDFQTLCEQINAYYNIRQLSGSMQQIMKDMYNVCPNDNPALKQALRDCISVMETSDDEFTQRMAANVIAMTGKNVAQAGFDELWSGVKRSFKAANPAAYIAQTIYESGKLITQVCFNTDEIQEKYCKIIALVNTENVLNTVYNNTKSSFKSAQSKGNAQAYNSAVDVMFNMLNSDCDYATAFADAVDSSLAGQISSLLGDDTIADFKDSVTSIKTSTDQFHETVLTYWIGELEKEGNGRYKDYEYLLDESWERMRKKYNVACPVDIYIYDTDGVIVGSVIDNVPYCRPDVNITISVEGDEKTIYMYGNEQYNISYVGNDAGEMDISIAEYDDTDNVTRNVYFNNIELTDGLTYNSADTGSNTGEDSYILTDENDLDITPGYDSLNDSDIALYTASIERGCFAEMTSIERELHVGENAEITAYVPNGYKFIGWTTDTGEDIFADAANVTTSICMPDHDIAIIANIEKCPTLSISDYTDNSVTVVTLNCEDIRGEVILAVYDETDTLKSVYQKPLDDMVIFENVNISNMNIKVMLWDSMENMKPLAAVVEQTL